MVVTSTQLMQSNSSVGVTCAIFASSDCPFFTQLLEVRDSNPQQGTRRAGAGSSFHALFHQAMS